MYIPVEKILNKIEEQLYLAKQANSGEEIKGKVQVIKVLCDLFLEDNKEEQQWNTSVSLVRKEEPQKKTALDDEDGANGDSLFDF